MSTLQEARTVSISVERPADEVYAYLSDFERFPEWSLFITAVKKDGYRWLATTPAGQVTVWFTPPNPYRIADHRVRVNDKLEVNVPLRVVENGRAGSEVLFTVFRQKDMPDHAFEADLGLALADLTRLKGALEQRLAQGVCTWKD